MSGYELLAELGRGTTGYVYKARDGRLNRVVTLKVLLLASGGEGSRQLARFHREARVLACLTGGQKPGIPTLHEVGEYQGLPYYVREYVEGHTLVQRVADRFIGVREGLGVLAAVARTVSRVHEQGFVHRNLRPSNVLIAADGASKLIGFGMACPTGPPMVAAGRDAAPTGMDVQALGQMATWLCAGLEQPVPTRLASVCDNCSRAGAAEFAEALAGYLDEVQPDA
jgi:serine/threonine protein kinase